MTKSFTGKMKSGGQARKKRRGEVGKNYLHDQRVHVSI